MPGFRRWVLPGALVLLLAGGGLWLTGGGEQPVAAPVTTPVAPSVAPVTPVPPLARSVPVRLRVPAIGVDGPLLSLGLNPDRTVQVPRDYGRAGWYREGPAPGGPGAAVLLGHIDSTSGPAVFYRLGTLHRGDRIEVGRADGSTATFAVDSRQQYPKARFPSAEVYGQVDYPALRLITCGGAFDRAEGSYLDNVVVYAHLVRAG